jgi:hypothetical protein
MATSFFYEFFREAREQELKQNGLVCPIARRGHWATAEENANQTVFESMPELESESDSDSDCGPVPLLFGNDEMYKFDKANRYAFFEFSRLLIE